MPSRVDDGCGQEDYTIPIFKHLSAAFPTARLLTMPNDAYHAIIDLARENTSDSRNMGLPTKVDHQLLRTNDTYDPTQYKRIPASIPELMPSITKVENDFTKLDV
ncbi:hypothetical protein PM082_010353 [Marasmius tenuissimus]|nr:hypothetical protein PM082_010353 [Marasmius tenuissimus]